MDKACTKSTFSGSRPLFITKPQFQKADPDLHVKKISSNVGGCCGCFTTPATTKVTFEKDQYYCGEQAKVTIECDNSQCEKDVAYFKF